MKKSICFFILCCTCFFTEAQQIVLTDEELFDWKLLKVKASAYNSTHKQTVGNPSIGAWGDTLKPGMKAVAISRDLLKLGISRGTPIKIEGYDGIYFVKDKMNARYRMKIDIYMGTNIQKARNFGNQRLLIWYGVPKKLED
ncbi:hypothetical protein [Galbibacter sp. PAP.153]|uniref:3D domain-containing protein n=1 Tax=Galbibacter sp. PAP.153 TaxID=3104623 RepID=UPI003009E4E4